jgi:hypothetical protein
MRIKPIVVFLTAMALMAGAAFTATAMPMGRQVPLDDSIIQFFAKNGVDPQYLTGPPVAVPADIWQKITTLAKDPSLAPLVLSDLRDDVAAFGPAIFLQIGDSDFQYARAAGSAAESFTITAAS